MTETITKACPGCGPTVRLVIRINRQTGHEFLGCPRWPGCGYTEPLPESIRLRRAGARELPGFETAPSGQS